MARIPGGLFTTTLDVNKRRPLDARALVSTREDLITPKTWIPNGLTTDSAYDIMIVSVNSDGEHNGVYYLNNSKAITAENYSAYQTALNAGEDVTSYFSMWTKLGTLDDIAAVERKIAEIKPAINLVPVDGTIVMDDAENGDKTIGVAIASVEGNALVAVDGGLFVPTMSIKVADNSHGLVAVDGVLTLQLATKDADGAMSKEDKMVLDALKEACAWGEI